MNPKKEFENILKTYGRDILIVRQERKLRCKCFNEVNKEVTRRCELCFGLGWTYIAERHKAYSVDQGISRQSPPMLRAMTAGDVSQYHRVYYLMPDCQISEEDIIIEVDWDDRGRPRYNKDGIYRTNFVARNLTMGNEKIFRAAYVSNAPKFSKLRGINISRIKNVIHYQIGLG